jgi:hypothetical protein
MREDAFREKKNKRDTGGEIDAVFYCLLIDVWLSVWREDRGSDE